MVLGSGSALAGFANIGAQLGVTVFFVLSGFLITTLLLKESAKKGRFSIRDFYFRRAFRIWPAFYLALAVIIFLGIIKKIPLSVGEAVSAGLFLRNYYPDRGWFLGHTWSLAVEEQFYLVWPLLLKFLGIRRAVWFAVGVIALEPVVRVVNYFLLPSSAMGQIIFMTHTRADSLMVGALIALLYGNDRFKLFTERLFAWKLPLAAVIFIFFCSPILEVKKGYAYLYPFGLTLENFAIALILLWAIENTGSQVGRFLNSRLVVRLGLLSYSIYLWQQPFLARGGRPSIATVFVKFFVIWVVAECSYKFVETPFLIWRKRFVADA